MWTKTKSQDLRKFYWQIGYGGFSVGRSELDTVFKYIENQEIHHKKRTFQEEYRQILQDYEIEFDERYIWDY